MKCDIIIPIYNAYECVIECVESVVRNTDLKKNRLILINDKSSDERIHTLLLEYQKKYSHFVILENDENQGFVKTVNRGMQYSTENDVLLLNSDTVVTPHWLENIKKCAYSGPRIATVTPLSNNATMASVPTPFVKNELPSGMTIDEMAKIVEDCSYRDYPDLPTGHGFCLYIKREVLNRLGYFDDETFGRGYGEENDFCFRCLDCGYRHLLCDNVYIYHKESQSFSDSKIALMASAQKKIESRYKEYSTRLTDWCRTLPIRYIGDNIALALQEDWKRPNILVVIHDFYDVKHHVGGTTLHIYDLIKALRKYYNFHVFYPNNNLYYVTSYYERSESTISYPHIFDSRTYQFYNNSYKKMIEEIIDSFQISLVHIHHMKNHYFDWTEVISKHNLKTIISLHDFYSICPLINKMYCHDHYCGNPSKETCGECLKKTLGFKQNMIEDWKEAWTLLLKQANNVIVPSKSCKEEIQEVYPWLKMKVIEHGVNYQKTKEELSIKDDTTYEVAFLGAIAKIKGSTILKKIIHSKHLKPIHLHLFGNVDWKLTGSEKKRILDHGKYSREELPSLLKENKIKLICLLSTVPETYSYTLTEAIASGIPVLGSNLGALKERIERDQIGWIIDLNTENQEEAVINKIKEIFADPIDYYEKVKNIRKCHIKTVEEMALEYHNLYKVIDQDKKQLNPKLLREKIHNNSKYITTEEHADYSWVFDTLKWKLIAPLKIPTGIKKLFRRSSND